MTSGAHRSSDDHTGLQDDSRSSGGLLTQPHQDTCLQTFPTMWFLRKPILWRLEITDHLTTILVFKTTHSRTLYWRTIFLLVFIQYLYVNRNISLYTVSHFPVYPWSPRSSGKYCYNIITYHLKTYHVCHVYCRWILAQAQCLSGHMSKYAAPHPHSTLLTSGHLICFLL